ncbi:hypothetical protein ABIB62_003016 [Mucilaginibacter sp. UYP25]|uniref:hypothetical protein n=1 Tax=unclassified Mucilaginibacter TaxID=2617802 RepID=UPI003391857A
MRAFHGIIIYEILENGNLLNGIYTNNGLLETTINEYCVDTEIARKKRCDKGLNGVYKCKYTETDVKTDITSVEQCDLEIINYNGVYKFVWSQNGKQIWTGLGLMAGNRHIAVSYDETLTPN